MLLKDAAESFNLTFEAFGKTISEGSNGSLNISDAWNSALEPAPISSVLQAPYKVLSGSIQATYSSRPNASDSSPLYISPGIMAGNTGQLL